MIVLTIDNQSLLPEDFLGSYTAYVVTNLAYRKSNLLKDMENIPSTLENREKDENFRCLFMKYAYYHREKLYNTLLTHIGNEVFTIYDDDEKAKQKFFDMIEVMEMNYCRKNNKSILCDINSPNKQNLLDSFYYSV